MWVFDFVTVAPREIGGPSTGPRLAFPQGGSGGTGRRTRLRIWLRKEWGFESPLSHLPRASARQMLV